VEEFPVKFVTITTGGAVRTLVVLTLVPEDAANPVGQFSLADAPEQAAVDCSHVGRVDGVPLVLVDAGTADCTVDEADGHFLLLDDALAEFHAPVPDCQRAALVVAMHCWSPETQALRAARHATEGPEPLALVSAFPFAPVRRHRVRLADDDEGISADQVVGGVQDRLLPVEFGGQDGTVTHEAGFQADRTGVAIADEGGCRLCVGLAVDGHGEGELCTRSIELAIAV